MTYIYLLTITQITTSLISWTLCPLTILCKWPQILDIAHSLTPGAQKKLYEAWPYLQESTDRQHKYISYTFHWVSQEEEIWKFDPTNFGFSYFKRSMVKEQVNKAEKLTSNQDHMEKTRNIKEVNPAKRKTHKIHQE